MCRSPPCVVAVAWPFFFQTTHTPGSFLGLSELEQTTTNAKQQIIRKPPYSTPNKLQNLASVFRNSSCSKVPFGILGPMYAICMIYTRCVWNVLSTACTIISRQLFHRQPFVVFLSQEQYGCFCFIAV